MLSDLTFLGTIPKQRRQFFRIFDTPLPHVGSFIVLSVGNFDQVRYGRRRAPYQSGATGCREALGERMGNHKSAAAGARRRTTTIESPALQTCCNCCYHYRTEAVSNIESPLQTYSDIHKSIAPSKELCSKMALGEVGVSLP